MMLCLLNGLTRVDVGPLKVDVLNILVTIAEKEGTTLKFISILMMVDIVFELDGFLGVVPYLEIVSMSIEGEVATIVKKIKMSMLAEWSSRRRVHGEHIHGLKH